MRPSREQGRPGCDREGANTAGCEQITHSIDILPARPSAASSLIGPLAWRAIVGDRSSFAVSREKKEARIAYARKDERKDVLVRDERSDRGEVLSP